VYFLKLIPLIQVIFMINNKIRDLIKVKGVSLKKFAESIDLTEAGFIKMLNSNSFKVETLLKISEKLNVSISYFFDDTNAKTEDINSKNIEILRKVFSNDSTFIDFIYLSLQSEKNEKTKKSLLTSAELYLKKYALLNESELDILVENGIFSNDFVYKIVSILTELNELK